MTTDRRLEILRAIVDEYVETQEPVGSKAIADKRALGISPATIRNEMAVLEEEGLITQPHTSAGRIPTDRGYRLFVDKISAVKPLSTAERRAIETFLEGAHDLDDVVKRSAKLLADITKQVAVVKYPKIGDSQGREMMAISGTANLARSGEDLGNTLSPILEALEEQVVLLACLAMRTRLCTSLSAANSRIQACRQLRLSQLAMAPMHHLESLDQPVWITQVLWQQFRPWLAMSVASLLKEISNG